MTKGECAKRPRMLERYAQAVTKLGRRGDVGFICGGNAVDVKAVLHAVNHGRTIAKGNADGSKNGNTEQFHSALPSPPHAIQKITRTVPVGEELNINRGFGDPNGNRL
jgi:hypothetical protein